MQLQRLLFCLLINFTGSAVSAQTFENLDFSQRCDSSKTGLCHWDLSWGSKESVSPFYDRNANSLLLQGRQTGDVAFTEQSSIIQSPNGIRILNASAQIRSENIEGKGAGLDIQVLDEQNRLLTFKDMGGVYSISWVQGTTGWKVYSIAVVCPAEAHSIKIGAILYGKGKAWFRDYKVSAVSIESRKPGKLALKYVTAACDTIRLHSLWRDSIDMAALKATALKIAGNAKRTSDCYLAVQYLLESLRPFGDEHSFFMTPAEVKNLESGGSLVSSIGNPSFRIIDNCGYILVPPFHGTNMKLKLQYADSLQDAIAQLSGQGIAGWIVDLRQNTGGDMEPMIMGLGPLFSSEVLGSLVNVNNEYDSWSYKNGSYSWSDGYSSKVSHPVSLDKTLPVAVLISNQTGSSGEAVAISFVGNEKTKFFGAPTWGLTTGNGSFDLMDGANIHLASTIMADRTGKKYNGPVLPDFQIADTGKARDKAIEAAIEWIKREEAGKD